MFNARDRLAFWEQILHHLGATSLRCARPDIDAIPTLNSTSPPPPAPPKNDSACLLLAQTGASGGKDGSDQNAKNLEKQKESTGFGEFLLFKEWCTRMESNHHAIAGTRT
jgi:hypothetical protein